MMTQETINRAFEAYNAARFEAARGLCAELLELPEGRAPALMLLGLMAERELHFDEAIAFLEQSVAIQAHPWSLMTLAGSLWRVGRAADGLAYAHANLDAQPESSQAHLVVANLLHALGRYEEALVHAQRAAHLKPGSGAVEARLGCVLTRLERYEDAEHHFESAARAAKDLALCRSVRFSRAFWDTLHAAADASRTLPDAVWARESGSPTVVAAVFCDIGYLRKYGPGFVNSFVRIASAGAFLHLRVAGVDRSGQEKIAAVLDASALTGAALTVESERALPLELPARRTLLTCARFLNMNALLDRYRLPVVCFDIDLVFESSLDSLLEATRHHDVALVRREPPDSPWLDIPAGYLVAQNTAMTRRYFEHICRYIRHHAEGTELHWHLDQIALYCVLTMMQRFSDVPRVRWMGADDMPVWHIGHSYDFRLEDERVARYRTGDWDL